MSGYDVIVVGGGSAGAAAASRISEDPSITVLLLEAGPAWRAPQAPAAIRLPAWGPCFDAFTLPGFHWSGILVRQTAAQAGQVPYMRGRGLGGSSTINGLVALRPPLDDFDHWPQDGPGGWSRDIALDVFCRLEDDLDFGPRPGHGQGGPVPISRAPAELWSELDLALRDAAADLGYPFCEDVHALDAPAQATWPIPSNTRGGRRVTCNDSFLEPARERRNLTIAGESFVERIVFGSSGRATGVRYRCGSQVAEAYGDEIVLCAGALGSPALLQRSGIGPSALLESLGIEVRADLPVGEALQDHPFLPLLVDLHEDPLCRDRPTVKCGVGYASGLPGGAPRDMLIAAGNRVRATDEWQLPSNIMVWQHECHSRGRLHITSADPDAPVAIDLGLLSDNRDLARMRDGLRRACELVTHPAFAKISSGVALGDAQVQTRTTSSAQPLADLDDDELDELILMQVASASHLSSTCPVGTVADTAGQVLGVGGLRVADLSIAPKIPRANTNLTAIMIGERIAESLAHVTGKS